MRYRMRNKILIFNLLCFLIVMAGGNSDMEGQIINVAKSAYEICPIKVGQEIPSSFLHKIDGTESDIKDLVKYELFSDSKANVSKAFGIAFSVENDYIQKLKSYNMDLEKSSGETHHILPVPSVFIVDEKGVIQFEYVNPDYKVRISSKLLLETARILK